jgi:hypothetical protein
MEAAMEQVHVEDLNPAPVRAFLDLPDGGVTEVESYSDAVMTTYFGEYSSTAKSFLISGGRNEAFKEFAGFCAQWMLLQSNLTVVTKVRGNLIIRQLGESAPGLGDHYVHRLGPRSDG